MALNMTEDGKSICIPPEPYEGEIPPRGMRLWVDDLREPDHTWTWAKTSRGAIRLLRDQHVREMSLDHDLGGDDTTRAVVLWLCEQEQAEGNNRWPEIVRVHSQNQVGVDWLMKMIARYQP